MWDNVLPRSKEIRSFAANISHPASVKVPWREMVAEKACGVQNAWRTKHAQRKQAFTWIIVQNGYGLPGLDPADYESSAFVWLISCQEDMKRLQLCRRQSRGKESHVFHIHLRGFQLFQCEWKEQPVLVFCFSGVLPQGHWCLDVHVHDLCLRCADRIRLRECDGAKGQSGFLKVQEVRWSNRYQGRQGGLLDQHGDS